jgi:integrase
VQLDCKITISLVEEIQSGKLKDPKTGQPIPIGTPVTVWEGGKGAIIGFGARRQQSKSVAFVLMYRTKDGKQRCPTIGKYGRLTPPQARDKAKEWLAQVAEGGDPAADKNEMLRGDSVADLCDAYLTACRAGTYLTKGGTPKRASTLVNDASRIESLIKPRIGRVRLALFSDEHVKDLQNWVRSGAPLDKRPALSRARGGKQAAAVSINLLSAICRYGITEKKLKTNPCIGVQRDKGNNRDRRLSNAEYKALGQALDSAPASLAPVTAVIRFLALTGWRQSEATDLRWSQIDTAARRCVIPTKVGASERCISRLSMGLILAQPRYGDLVFCRPDGRSFGKQLCSGTTGLWRQVIGDSLPLDVGSHVLRHSFVSLADDMEITEATLAELVGHRESKKTQTGKYTHKTSVRLRLSADRIAQETAARMRGEETELMREEAADATDDNVIELFRNAC